MISDYSLLSSLTSSDDDLEDAVHNDLKDKTKQIKTTVHIHCDCVGGAVA